MSSVLRSLTVKLLVLALMLAPLPGLGQTPAPQAPEDTSVFGETIEVRVVNLEVVVVDKQGNRVHDLAPADFRLSIDGKPAKIDYFTEVQDGRAVQEEEAPAAGAATQGVAGIQPGSDVGTSYVVFVDDLFSVLPRNRDLVLRGIIDQLEQLGPSDRMAVVAFDGRRPKLLSNWSNSRIELRQALERAIERRGRGLGIAAEVAQNDAVEALNPNETPAEAFGGGPSREDLGLSPANASEVASYCALVHRLENRVRQVTTGVTATMRSLAGVPGRKVMLLVTGGWPRTPKDYVIGQVNPLDVPADCGTEGADLYEPIQQIANRIGFTLYPIVAPEPPGAGGGGEAREAAKDFGPDTAFRFAEVQETAYHLARETGGKPFAAGARLDALKSVVADTRSYYWLGFTPSWKGDDRQHKVRIEMTRPGLEVRTRTNYLDLSRKAEVSYMVESALMFGNAPGTYPLPIRLGPIPTEKKDKLKVPLQVGIPMQLITMIERGGKYVGELELRVAVVNDRGERNDLPVIPVRLEGAKAPTAGQVSVYKVDLELRRQKQDVVIALFDPPTGRLFEAMTEFKP